MQETTPIIFSKHHTSCVVGVLDIVRSTEITLPLTADNIDEFYRIFLEMITDTLVKNSARLIKNIGDGVLFYFPDTVALNEHSLLGVVTCAHALHDIREQLNVALAKASLPAISFRVSLSYGPVSAMLGERGEISDLFGATVTTCAKINRLADENTCVVGEALHNVLLPYYQDMEKKTEYRIGDSVSFSVFTLNYDKE